MPDPRKQVLNVDVEYPEYLVKIKFDLADFIYEDGVWDDLSECGLDSESDLWKLEGMLTMFPESGPVIPGTGGLRKLRWGMQGKGKRGGVRVIYMWIPDIYIFYIFSVYKKSERDDLSSSEKRELKRYAEVIQARLRKSYQ